MANYSIVINSRFKPFSYAEMLAPVQQSTEAHQQVEDAYANLATQAELVAGKANEQTDPIAYARYKSYADDLMAQADRLARYGLTPDDRRSMLGLRARYAKDIIPIQEAIETRKKQAEMQQQAYLQNPTLLLSRRASTTSLDEYLKNPNLEYDSYSGAMLTQQVSQQAQALAKELTEYGLGKPIDAYTNTFLKRNGFTSAQVLEAITNPDDPKSSPVLKAIVDQTLASSGVTKWGDEATIARARAYANQGLFSAVGTSDVAPMENFAARENLRFSHQVALENLQHQHAMARQRQAQRAARAADAYGGGGGDRNSHRLNPIPLRDRNEVSQKMNKINYYISKGWMKEDKSNPGHYVLTVSGHKEYNRMSESHAAPSMNPRTMGYYPTTSTGTKLHSDFYNFINNNKGKTTIKQVKDINAVLNSVYNSNKEGSYDLYRTTEYDRSVTGDYASAYTNQIMSTLADSSDKKLHGVSYKAGKGFVETKSYSPKDLKGYKVSNIRYSKYGNTAILQKEGNDPIRVRLPKGMNPTAETNVSTAISNADDYLNISNKGYMPKVDSYGRLARDKNGNIIYTNTPLTESQLGRYMREADNALLDIGDFGSQIVVVSDTKKDEYTPFQ